jgi:hypothetical protein
MHNYCMRWCICVFAQSLPPKFAAGLGVLCPAWRAAAKLRDRTGRSWDVELRRDAGHHRVSFTGGGWRGFVSANALSAGQLLVFEHRGCLDFAVDRFDASGCCCDDDQDGGGVVVAEHMATTTTIGTEATAVKRRRRSPLSTTTTVSGGDDNDETLCRRIERAYQLRFLVRNCCSVHLVV